jgi:predicted permease
MNVWQLFNLQGTLFIMILAGVVLKKIGVLDASGKKTLTDLCVDIVIPCNIIKSFLVGFQPEVIRSCAGLLVVGFLLQLLRVVFNKFLFNRYPDQQRKVLQYCTIVSMGGFLGNPVAEGVFGDLGLLYTSMFLIPMRVVMWSAGTSYFVAGSTDKKKVIKNVLTHPCLVAVYVGLILMITQFQLPEMLVSAIRSVGGCNSALTMFIIGTILADVKVTTIVTPTTLAFSVFRLGILPAIAFGVSLLFGLDNVATGIAVLMTGMPAGATAAIFAARYDSDAPFATRCVVLTTLISMLTLPVWCLVVG